MWTEYSRTLSMTISFGMKKSMGEFGNISRGIRKSGRMTAFIQDNNQKEQIQSGSALSGCQKRPVAFSDAFIMPLL
jgi:hypothetical protein